MSITLKPKAAEKLQQLISAAKKPGTRFRIYIEGGGCSGFQYGFAFDPKQNPDDFLFEECQVPLVVDSLSWPYISGAEIDYVKNLEGERFVVSNPNANTTCGCGSSFSV